MQARLYLLLFSLLPALCFSQSGIPYRERPQVSGQQVIKTGIDGKKYILEKGKTDVLLQVPLDQVPGAISALSVRPVQMSMAQVRAFSQIDTPKQISLIDAGQEGLFQIDEGDAATPDNTGTVLVTATGKRYKRIYGSVVQLSWFKPVMDSTSNAGQAAIQAAIYASKNRTLFWTKGVYGIGSTLNSVEGITIEGNKAKLKALNDIPVVAVAGGIRPAILSNGISYVTIHNLDYDAGNYVSDGYVATSGASHYTVTGCEIQRYRHKWGLADLDSKWVSYKDNYLHDTDRFSIHSYKGENIEVVKNHVNVAFAGYYTAGCRHVYVGGNNLWENIEDVCQDFEEGIDNLATGNVLRGFGLGGCTIYAGDNLLGSPSTGIVFSNNIIHQTATYLKYKFQNGVNSRVVTPVSGEVGAVNFYSWEPGASGNGATDNTIYVDSLAGQAFFVNPQLVSTPAGNTSAFITRNRVYTKSGTATIYDFENLDFSENTFYCLTGSEGYQAYLREQSGGSIRKNTWIYSRAKTSNPALMLQCGTGWAKSPVLVAENTFVGCGSLAMGIDAFNNGIWSAKLIDNNLGPEFTPNGGLTISGNGRATLHRQRLNLQLPSSAEGFSTNLGNLPALSQTTGAMAHGFIGLGRAGYNGVGAWVHYMHGSGAFVTGANSVGGLSVNASGPGLILTNGTGTPIFGQLAITVDTY